MSFSANTKMPQRGAFLLVFHCQILTGIDHDKYWLELTHTLAGTVSSYNQFPVVNERHSYMGKYGTIELVKGTENKGFHCLKRSWMTKLGENCWVKEWDSCVKARRTRRQTTWQA